MQYFANKNIFHNLRLVIFLNFNFSDILVMYEFNSLGIEKYNNTNIRTYIMNLFNSTYL